MTFFNSSFDIVSVVFPEAKLPETLDPNYFLWIPASDADAAVNPIGINRLLPNAMSTFFINRKLTFITSPRSLSSNPLDCITLNSRGFDNFTLTDEFFGKDLQILETYVSVNPFLINDHIL